MPHMRYEANIQAYDMLDRVALAVTVWTTGSWTGERCEVVLRVTDSLAGEGQDDAREWLRDALIGVLEAL